MILSSRAIRLSTFLILLSFLPNEASTVSSAGRRVWEIAVDTQATTETVESKICELEVIIPEDISGTFTAIDAVQDKVCTVDSKVDVTDSLLDQLNSDIQTVASKVEVLEQETSIMCDTITIIRVEDFGGTWTALDELDQTLCEKFDSAFDSLATIESKIDQLSADNLAQFTATFTKLQELSSDVFDTMTKVQNLADQIESDLGDLDSLIDIVKNDFSTIESKIDLLDVTIEQNFAGTFTAIEAIFEKVCDVDNKVDQLDTILETGCVGTFTSLKAVEEKVCIADSKVDVLNELLELIKEKTSIIDAPIIEDCSLVDVLIMDLQTLDSKVDIVSSKMSNINNRLDVVDMTAETVIAKLCTSESSVDQIDNIESLVDVLNSTFETIESKIDLVELSACTVESKICAVDSQTNSIGNDLSTMYSHLEVIETNAQTIDSLVDVIDANIPSLESKLCIVDETVNTLDSSVDVVCHQIQTIDSKIDVIGGTVDTMLILGQSIESTVEIVESKVEEMLNVSYTIESKACTIDTTLITIDSSIDVINTNVNSADNDIDESFVNFDMTWTMLPFFQEKLCTVDSKTDVISSLVENIQVEIDLGGTFTAIDAIFNKACSIEEIAEEQLNRACLLQGGLAATFTVQDEILEKLCASSSQLDEISLSTTLLDPIQSCIGTPIRQADVGTTGFTISTEGRYYLAENITFSPGAAAAAITISADNVCLDLNKKELKQGNTTSGVNFITATGRDNIKIINGILDGSTSNIISLFTCTNVVIDELLILNCAVQAVRFSECSKLIIRNTTEVACFEGLLFFECSDILIEKCVITEGTGFQGISFTATVSFGGSSRCCIRDCYIAKFIRTAPTTGNGIHFNGNGIFSDFLIERCVIIENGGFGFAATASTTTRDVVVRDCIIQRNMHGIGVNVTNNIVNRLIIINNDISGNLISGIRLAGSSVSNNIILFNRLIENGGDNISEDAGAGPNTILGNFAFHSGGDSRNYSLATTTINKVIVSQSGAFPTTIPTYWHNISMIP